MKDRLQRERIESLNKFSSFVYGLKGQVNDQDGLGGKLDTSDKQTLKDLLEDGIAWIDDNGATASTEDLEEKMAGRSNCAQNIDT